jgi:hypothetical protein
MAGMKEGGGEEKVQGVRGRRRGKRCRLLVIMAYATVSYIA